MTSIFFLNFIYFWLAPKHCALFSEKFKATNLKYPTKKLKFTPRYFVGVQKVF